MSAKFVNADPYNDDVLALPVTDINHAATWYSEKFGMVENSRKTTPHSQVILERDGVQIGFAINDGDPEQEGAAIEVTNIESLKTEFENRGVMVGDWRIDERDGKSFQVFFVIAPDRLCYYFYQAIEE